MSILAVGSVCVAQLLLQGGSPPNEVLEVVRLYDGWSDPLPAAREDAEAWAEEFLKYEPWFGATEWPAFLDPAFVHCVSDGENERELDLDAFGKELFGIGFTSIGCCTTTTGAPRLTQTSKGWRAELGRIWVANMDHGMYTLAMDSLLEIEPSTAGSWRATSVRRTRRDPTTVELGRALEALRRRPDGLQPGWEPGRKGAASMPFLGTCVSPDGEWILFPTLLDERGERLPTSEIARVRRDGSNFAVLTRSAGWEIGPRVLPDGETLLSYSDRWLRFGEPLLLGPGEREPRPIACSSSAASDRTQDRELGEGQAGCLIVGSFRVEPLDVARDGMLVLAALVNNDTQLFSIESLGVRQQPRSTRVTQLTSGRGRRQSPLFTLDGHEIVYARHYVENNQSLCDLEAVSRAGTVRTILPRYEQALTVCGWTWRRELIVLALVLPSVQDLIAGRQARPDRELWVVDPEDGSTRSLRLPSSIRAPRARVSPDGRRVAVEVDVGRASELFVVTVEEGGAGPQPVTELGGRVADPSWSPDGTWVAFLFESTTGIRVGTARLGEAGLASQVTLLVETGMRLPASR